MISKFGDGMTVHSELSVYALHRVQITNVGDDTSSRDVIRRC